MNVGERGRMPVWPWPASKKTTKELITHNFVVCKNQEYH